MTGTIRLVAVNGGLGNPSSTRLLIDRTIDAVTRELDAAGTAVEVSVIDLRDIAVDIARSMTTGFPGGGARTAIEQVEAADAVIAATPVFNASYSGLFKSFFDLVDVEAMTGKPVLIEATGGSPRHSMVLDHALRPMFGYLRAVVLPTGIYAASEDWADGSGDTTTLADRIGRAAREVAGALPTSVSASSKGSGAGAADPVVLSGEVRERATEAAGIANFARLLGATE